MTAHAMQGIVAAALAAGLLVGPVVMAQGPGQGTVVVLETEKGAIEITVETEKAPVTSEAFLRYVDDGLYDGGQFHRTVRPGTETREDYPIQVIQGSRGRGGRGHAPIPLERTRDTGLRHVDGAVSMARVANQPDSARSDIFICIGDQPELDFGGRRNADGQGFAVFGRVTAGMDVVRAIHQGPVREGTQSLNPAIVIVRAHRK